MIDWPHGSGPVCGCQPRELTVEQGHIPHRQEVKGKERES